MAALVVLVIWAYSSYWEAAVRVRNFEMTTPEGDASAAETAVREAAMTSGRTARRRRRMRFLLSFAFPETRVESDRAGQPMGEDPVTVL